MKTNIYAFLSALLFSIAPLMAQPAPAGGRSATNSTGDYVSNIAVVSESQQQALAQAQEMLASGEGVRDTAALQTAIEQMQLAQSALNDAKNSPDKLPVAIAAEQAAYQALLKVMPREYRMTQQQRNSQQGQQSGQAGQASQRQMDQLDMQREENRYETESQASAPQNAQQREQTQTVDRLKELSQRQQDLNDRLRELQTQLQAARTDTEREDIQRQLKRLQDEQRQMLANVDQLRQDLNQSPNASSQADTQQQLEQTRNDMERAAREMQNQSASGALAAGQRAQEAMQNLRDNLRKQTSSQFSDQMRQLRNEARDLTKQQDEIARGLDSLQNGEHQALDNAAGRQQIVQQMEKQQSTLTNLLSQMRAVTEQAEATEPLLSKQLYDTLRRADQMHTDNLLEMGSQLTDRGFLPQASQAERAARTNITELASSVERAADSVLGSEADALRYAQKELDDLTRQVERELGGTGTNGAALGLGGTNGAGGQSNRVALANGRNGNAARGQGTNSMAQANGRSPGNDSQSAENNSQGQPSGNRGEQANGNGNQSQQPNANGNNGEQASAGNPQPGQRQGQGRGPGQEQAQNQGQGQEPTAGENNGGRGNRGGNPQQANNAPGDGSQRGEQAQAGGNAGGGDRLRQLAVQLGGGGSAGGLGNNGPITGNEYVNWSDRLRDVEQVVDPADLRNQLATVRERASVLRADYRANGRKPDADVVRQQILTPLTQVRVWLQEELARKEKSDSLVPLDRDPVPDNYADLVRKYYEKLGSAQ